MQCNKNTHAETLCNKLDLTLDYMDNVKTAGKKYQKLYQNVVKTRHI